MSRPDAVPRLLADSAITEHDHGLAPAGIDPDEPLDLLGLDSFLARVPEVADAAGFPVVVDEI